MRQTIAVPKTNERFLPGLYAVEIDDARNITRVAGPMTEVPDLISRQTISDYLGGKHIAHVDDHEEESRKGADILKQMHELNYIGGFRMPSFGVYVAPDRETAEEIDGPCWIEAPELVKESPAEVLAGILNPLYQWSEDERQSFVESASAPTRGASNTASFEVKATDGSEFTVMVAPKHEDTTVGRFLKHLGSTNPKVIDVEAFICSVNPERTPPDIICPSVGGYVKEVSDSIRHYHGNLDALIPFAYGLANSRVDNELSSRRATHIAKRVFSLIVVELLDDSFPYLSLAYMDDIKGMVSQPNFHQYQAHEFAMELSREAMEDGRGTHHIGELAEDLKTLTRVKRVDETMLEYVSNISTAAGHIFYLADQMGVESSLVWEVAISLLDETLEIR